MAIAELSTRGLVSSTDDEELRGDVDLRVDVHDKSRLEWIVTAPVPKGRRGVKYSIAVEIEIPANVFARHSPWDQLQSWTRLDGPAETVQAGETVTIDALRRGAIAYAHKLARASEGFSRHCRLAGGISVELPLVELVDGLNLWINFASEVTSEARARLVAPAPGDGAELRRERVLVDEYLSVRLLELLAGAERALAALSTSRRAASYGSAIGDAEASLAEALEVEIAHRRAQRFLCPEPSLPVTLERYLERASRLKKHFQEVLFLEAEMYQVADRIHHWVAAFVALLASTWAFAWQIALANRAPTATTTVSSGIVVLAVVAGAVYALKDRMKEVGRNWISGNVHRFYAQRVARWRAPERRLQGRDVIVSARESFDQSVVRRPDPLNPDCSASVPTTVLKFTHRGQILPHAGLVDSGVRRVKHIFRYDLSPLFARLDDAVKQVPVLDKTTRRVCFTDAPRCYRVPVRIRVTCDDVVRDEDATLVLHKRGLERLELDDPDRDAHLDTGVVPS